MNKTRNAILSLLGFMALSIVVLSLSPDGARYDVGDPVHKVEWIGEQLEKPRRTYDYVFIGSSHIWNGIDTPLVSRELSKIPGGAINLGMNWFGRDRDWVVARDFLKHHTVKNLVIECTWDEWPESHLLFKYLASPLDVFQHPFTQRLLTLRSFRFGLSQAKNDAIFVVSRLADISIGIYVRALRHLHGVREKTEIEQSWDGQMGYLPDPTSPKIAEAFRATQKPFGAPERMSATPFANKLGDEFAYEELKRIADDAHSHGTRLIFLFVSHRFNWTDNPAKNRLSQKPRSGRNHLSEKSSGRSEQLGR